VITHPRPCERLEGLRQNAPELGVFVSPKIRRHAESVARSQAEPKFRAILERRLCLGLLPGDGPKAPSHRFADVVERRGVVDEEDGWPSVEWRVPSHRQVEIHLTHGRARYHPRLEEPGVTLVIPRPIGCVTAAVEISWSVRPELLHLTEVVFGEGRVVAEGVEAHAVLVLRTQGVGGDAGLGISAEDGVLRLGDCEDSSQGSDEHRSSNFFHELIFPKYLLERSLCRLAELQFRIVTVKRAPSLEDLSTKPPGSHEGIQNDHSRPEVPIKH